MSQSYVRSPHASRSRVGGMTRTAAAAAAVTVALAGCGLRVAEDTVVAQAGSAGAAAQDGVSGEAVEEQAADPGAAAADPGAGTDAGAQTGGGGGAASTGGAATTSGGESTTAGGPAAKAGETKAEGGIAIDGDHSQGVSDKDIKVGVLAPISGAAGFLGQNQVDGIAGQFGLINAKGGIRGRQLKTVVVDTQFDPSAEATGARQLVEQQKVFLLMGVLGDSSAPYVTSKGIPNIVIGITPPAFSSKYPTTYPMSLNTIDSVVVMAHYFKAIKKAPIKTTAVVYDTQNMNISPWVDFLEKAWTVQGVEVKSKDAFNLSDGNCDQLVVKVRNLNVDFWQAGQSLGWPICLASAARQNYKPPHGIGGPYSADAKFVGGAGKGSDGVYAQNNGVQIAINTGQPYAGDPSGKAPEVDNYIKSVKTYGPNSADITGLENIWTQVAWAGARLAAEAIEAQTKAVTWKGVNQYIQGLTNWKSGLIQPVNSFKPDCKTGAQQYIFQWKRQADGKLVQSDWKPYGGVIKVPDATYNKILPGSGACFIGKMADTGMR